MFQTGPKFNQIAIQFNKKNISISMLQVIAISSVT
jgi:hypothetical protein